MSKQLEIESGLKLIFEGISALREAFDGRRKFTIDGRLVGDIGEVIAELEYDLEIDAVSEALHDGTTSDGRRVQVKATFQNHLTFKGGYDIYLGLKLNQNGTFQEVYNGPGDLIAKRYAHRKGMGESLLSFPVNELAKLQAEVGEQDKVCLRRG
tara:strand:- start:1097 stop:1558 length:462 start_codon:yes stop_codon:yes gene_type:complete